MNEQTILKKYLNTGRIAEGDDCDDGNTGHRWNPLVANDVSTIDVELLTSKETATENQRKLHEYVVHVKD